MRAIFEFSRSGSEECLVELDIFKSSSMKNSSSSSSSLAGVVARSSSSSIGEEFSRNLREVSCSFKNEELHEQLEGNSRQTLKTRTVCA